VSRTTPPSSPPDTLTRAEDADRKLADHLDRNDAYGYFDAIGDLLVTGPTHTNVNDFRALLICSASRRGAAGVPTRSNGQTGALEFVAADRPRLTPVSVKHLRQPPRVVVSQRARP
jgi:MOFRL family